ncbi:YbhB/YbcL family Raf kinase inhibitor-like protein, partial [Klebsiella pneumoniae]|uniref:YbhB/YbcL family Raf kinase inhibitor-like protein n=1 Tax=Klebsiella pneumoniae TaxID=573 RepID=UPI003F7FB684
GKPAYLGPCPPKGTGMHHYVFLLIATDLAPDALPNGLTRAELDAAIKGHRKGAAAWIGRFGNFCRMRGRSRVRAARGRRRLTIPLPENSPA